MDVRNQHALDARVPDGSRVAYASASEVERGPIPGWAKVIEAVRAAKSGGAGPTATQLAQARTEIDAVVAGL